MLQNDRHTLNKTERLIQYFLPMPRCNCTLPKPLQLINKHVHRIPIDIELPERSDGLSYKGMEIRLRWTHEDGEEFFGGQAPIIKTSPEKRNVRAIVQSNAPPQTGEIRAIRLLGSRAARQSIGDIRSRLAHSPPFRKRRPVPLRRIYDRSRRLHEMQPGMHFLPSRFHGFASRRANHRRRDGTFGEGFFRRLFGNQPFSGRRTAVEHRVR